VFINTVDTNTGYTADVAIDSFICQGANAGYTADAAMHSYICQTQDCSYSSTHIYQHDGESSKEHIIQQRQSELDRFMNDALDVSLKRVVDGKIIATNMKDEPLRWWRERGQHLYPTLVTMAFDLFAIPGMSSECERAFSAAIRLLTDDRYMLHKQPSCYTTAKLS
jgi:hypothetical protein